MTTEQTEGMKELREALDRANTERDQAQADLRTFSTSVTFKEQGYTPKHAELYLKTNPEGDVSAEAVQAFANEYGLAPTEVPVVTPAPGNLPPDGSPPPVERILGSGPPPDANLRSFADVGGSPAGQFEQAAPAKMAQKDFQKLLADNPDAAAQAYREGRVERNEGNVQADQLVQKGVINR